MLGMVGVAAVTWCLCTCMYAGATGHAYQAAAVAVQR